MKYKALWVSEISNGKFERRIVQKNTNELPTGEVLVHVRWTALNYKDALSASGNKGITRNYPHTPGIDAAGTVEESSVDKIPPGEEVIVCGYDLGMNTFGGFGEYIRVPAAWVMKKPREYSLKECMIIGTAGFTAAFGLFKMELLGQHPGMGPILVTGSTGGVGSLAIAIFAKGGYRVWATTGKKNSVDYLKKLGAERIEGREFVVDTSNKNLLRPQWAGAIDSVGGNTLVTLMKGCIHEGSVVATGLVDSPKISATVYPFILNGINLLGVGSAETAMEMRIKIWQKLESSWNIKDKLGLMAKEVSLEELNEYIGLMLEGKLMGRIVVKF